MNGSLRMIFFQVSHRPGKEEKEQALPSGRVFLSGALKNYVFNHLFLGSPID